MFGVLTEGCKYPSTMLFNYDTVSGKVQLIDLKKQFAQVVTAGCQTSGIVIKLSSAKPCASNGLWVLGPTGNSVSRLQLGTPFQSLFNTADSGEALQP